MKNAREVVERFIEKIRRCRAREWLSNIRKVFNSWTSKHRWVYPYYVELETEDRLYNKRRVFGTNTLRRGARVRRMDSRKDLEGKVTLP